jgi:hypothetical protein
LALTAKRTKLPKSQNSNRVMQQRHRHCPHLSRKALVPQRQPPQRPLLLEMQSSRKRGEAEGRRKPLLEKLRVRERLLALGRIEAFFGWRTRVACTRMLEAWRLRCCLVLWALDYS